MSIRPLSERGKGRGYFHDGRARHAPLTWQLPPSSWPAADRLSWERACAPPGPFTPLGSAAFLAAKTKEVRTKVYGGFLSFLQSEGWFDPDQPLASRLNQGIISAYIKSMLLTCRASTVRQRILELTNFLRAIAPTEDWKWIRRNPHMPTPAEVRASKKPILPPVPYKVLKKCECACNNASTIASRIDAAIAYRNGVLMMILIAHAPRLKNLAEIRVGEHLRFYPSHIRLVYEHSVKNHEIIDVNVPDFLAVYVREYYEVYRPILLRGGPDHQAFWVNTDGRALQYSTMNLLIQKTTAKWGCRMKAHDARYAMATTIMTADPRQLSAAAAALAHRGISSVNQVYDKSGSLGAQAAWLKMSQEKASSDKGVERKTRRFKSLHKDAYQDEEDA